MPAGMSNVIAAVSTFMWVVLLIILLISRLQNRLEKNPRAATVVETEVDADPPDFDNRLVAILAGWQKRQDESHEELMSLLRQSAADQAGLLTAIERHFRVAFGGRGYTDVNDQEGSLMEEIQRFSETYGTSRKQAEAHIRSRQGSMGGRV